MPSILISGASVAGPALAYWMATSGWDVTVVERADALREEGQNIDVRGAGRDVLRWMGLEDEVRAANTGERGTEFVDSGGEVVAALGVQDGEQDGPTAELEVLRGELARVLYELTPDIVEWRFGDTIEALKRRPDGVDVRFAGGDERTFDVVAIAEGQRSATRDLVFSDVTLEPLGVYIAYATIPRAEHDRRTWRWYHAPGGRQVSLRPDNLGTTRAMLGFLSDERGHDERSREEQIALLRDVFGDAGWETPRILAALEGADFYFEDLAMVHAPSWSQGRVVLLGDAAHCVTPLGGGGTSLALIDAYVLARELSEHAEPARAFAAYEAFMRPAVEAAQQLPPGVPRVAFPESRLGVRLLRAGEKLAHLAQRLIGSPTPAIDELELPPPR
ncbi:FAD-dependent monooxygenase [Solirubrobacter phytolaccae]|uniref:FAD-dependent monooxygenase n=1 Tax=Solirubrobacter phytolaccae TaxID=1404360 RepID=A0A9X3N4V8_9ACTN|nr:FAD-dependent monooxygenase [Solirubrobacter phytolaccae]MDA0179783.1 FAD-dependent monooxygenase [Solirubrobacter phytolaccae]